MPAASSLAALMQSPATSSDSTIIAHGRTLPDVSLGSLGSSFRSDDEEANGPARLGLGAVRPPVQRLPTLPRIDSPPGEYATPSPPPSAAAALLLSPPSTAQRTMPDDIETPGTHAPRRSRIMRSAALGGSASSISSSDADGPSGSGVRVRYADTDEDSDATGVLASLSVNVTPGAKGRKGYGAPSKRSGRHSVALEGTGPKTLREQEQELDAVKKDNFNLQLENHFLKERLANMAPNHIEAALKENVKLKLEILNLSKEMKKIKKLLLQQDKDLAEAQRERDGRDAQGSSGKAELRELERLYKEEKERRRAAEKDRDAVAGDEGWRAKLEDAEASEKVWRSRCEQLEEEVEGLKGGLDDMEAELAKQGDRADRAEDDIQRMRAGGSPDALGERVNELSDRLAAAQLDLDRRDQEIEELNAELDTKLREHEKELGQVEAEWRDEVMEARAQVDELKDALETREQDMKDIREALLDREEEAAVAAEKVNSLEAVQAETHDRLEETLKNIERDNAEKEADLIAANREIEELGQRVYDLEELAEELRARETELVTDLRSADGAFSSSKTQYESLVAALKEARQKLQLDLDDVQRRYTSETNARASDRQAHDNEVDRLQRDLADKDTHLTRARREAEDARERVAMRDRDLAKLQNMLKGLEDAKRRLGDEATSDKFGLELEMERVRRDLESAEAELDEAREALNKRDLEYSQMLDKQRELQDALSAERQARLNMSDKLDEVMKSAKRHEREATLLRERLDEVEPLLTETQQQRFSAQKQSSQELQERSELLLKVFKDVNRFLGSDDSDQIPSNFAAFQNALTGKLRSMNQVRGDFDKRVKELEGSLDQRMAALKRQLEQKWRSLDGFEASVKKLDMTRMQWKSKYALKEGELDAAKSRIADLTHQLSSSDRNPAQGLSSSQTRSLSDRADRAEKRAAASQAQLAQLEARYAEMQARTGLAEDKWAARVKEYENRLRIAGEKIKTEKQGGKERAMQLESQVRDLEKQLDGAKRRNQRAEGVVATAAHLLPASNSGRS